MRIHRLPAVLVAVLTFILGVASASLWFVKRAAPKQSVPVERQAAPCPPSKESDNSFVMPDVDWAASNRAEERDWSRKSGLPASLIRKLRYQVGLSDEPYAGMIDNVDTRGLKSRDHILFVTAGGNGHCLDLYVFQRKGNEIEEIWHTGEMPGGAGFCRNAPANPEAYVTHDGKIEVKIVGADYHKLIMDEKTEFLTYAWNGNTYSLESHKTIANR